MYHLTKILIKLIKDIFVKNITIKSKLIISSSIIVFLVLGLAIYSNIGITKSSEGFKSYKEMAQNTILASGTGSGSTTGCLIDISV